MVGLVTLTVDEKKTSCPKFARPLLTWAWETGEKDFQKRVDGQPKVQFGNGKRRWTRIGVLYHAHVWAKPNDGF
jgi:hypothetical protein